MNHLTVLFVAVVVSATALGGVTIWSPQRLAVKVGALALSVALMASSYGAFAELLGRPKPASLEWVARTEGATVVGARLREGEAIYLWLELESPSEPRAYVLPWSQANARQLQRAMQEVESKGGQVRMRGPIQSQQETQEPLFYTQPQRPPDPKPAG